MAPLLKLLLMVVASGIVAGIALAVVLLIAEAMFKLAYRIIYGRNYIFTTRRASQLSFWLAMILAGAFLFEIAHALETGQTLASDYRRGPTHVINWQDGQLAFIWALVQHGLALAVSWAGLDKAARFLSQDAKSDEPG